MAYEPSKVQAYLTGVRLACGDMGLSKVAGSRMEEALLGPLSSGLNKNPHDTFGKAYVRNATTGLGAGLGVLPGLAVGLSGHPVIGTGLGLAGLIGGGVGGRLLGEHMTDYDPKRGY